MRRAVCLACLLAALAAAPARAHESEELRCAGGAMAPAAEGEGNKYAPDRAADILNIAIDVTPDFRNRIIGGTTTIRFAPIAFPLRELKLDAVRLRVSSVESSAKVQAWQATDDAIVITFAEPIPVGQESTVTIAHSAEPRKGIYFRTPEMGYKPEDEHLWSQGEPSEARHWYPTFDFPNEKSSTEVTCRVPQEMVVLSNGRLESEKTDPATGLKVVHWVQEKPVANYLIALVAGKFKKIEAQHGSTPLAFWTPASQIANAEASFRGTAEMIDFFEKETGLPYPWDKYHQVVVDDFTWGGMENVTLTVLTDRTLHTAATENIRSSQGLVAHELAHQWFGDYVTCKDWSQLWLNEGFATFYAHLYDGHADGRDAELYGFYKDTKRIFDMPDASKPIVFKGYATELEQFGARAYEKGSWVLRMLRVQLGEELYRKGIKLYLERMGLKSVATDDLRRAFEEVSGKPLDRFFDQWVYHGGVPALEVGYSWDEAAKLAKVSVKQTQETNDKVLLFSFPVKVRFKTEKGSVEREIEVAKKQEDFYFPLESAPKIARFDADYGTLAKVSFSPPSAMLFAQLGDKDDVVGRLLAIEALKSRKDSETIGKLKAALNGDAFYGVRVEASQALREMKTDEAFAALAESMEQPDARARKQVTQDVGSFYRGESLEAAKRVLKKEKNPDVLAGAIESLGKHHDSGVRDLLMYFLESKSYRNALADAAIQAIRAQDDPAYIDPLRRALDRREKEFTSWGYGRGLEALGYIARTAEKKDGVREFLLERLNHKKRGVQISAINALGALRDPKALSAVEAFNGGDDDDPVQRAARDAAKAMREAKAVPVELKDLREETLALKKSQEEMKKDVEDLKKRFEAKGKAN